MHQGRGSSLLANRNFMLLYTGKLVSLLGDTIFIIALSWYILVETGTPLAAGVNLAVGALPFVVIGPFTGVLSDWFERRMILVAMDCVRGVLVLAMAGLLWIHAMPVWLLVLGSFLIGSLGAVFNPAASAILPNIVDTEQLTRAVSLDQVLSGICNLLGLSAGGILFGLLGIEAVFVVNAASHLVSGGLELCMQVPPHSPASRGEDSAAARYLGDLREGLRYLAGHRTILTLFMCVAVANFMLYPQGLIYIPYFYREVLHAPAGELSVVIGSLFAGTILGALLRFRPRAQQEEERRSLLRGLLAAAVAHVLFAVTAFAPVAARLTVHQVSAAFIVLSVLLGYGLVTFNVPVSVIVQKRVADTFRGRVWAVLGSMAGAVIPLSYLAGGIVARVVPLSAIFVASGLVFLVLLAVVGTLDGLRTTARSPAA